MVEGTPPGDAFPPPPRRATPARKGARCGAGAWSPCPHRPHPGHTGRGTLTARSRGRAAGGGTAPNTRRPSQCWKAPPPGMPIHHPHAEQRTNAPTHRPRDIRTPSPALRHSDTAMAEPAAPRKTRPPSPTLDEAHEVIRALGLRDGKGDPPQGDAGTDSDLEALLEPPAGGAPAEPAPPAGSVPAICPAWKRGHCTGEGRCPKEHPQPSPDDRALPEVKPAAARAALRYGVAQGWILDETARGSVNIQEAVNEVTHAGQAAVALHSRGRHGGPAEGIIVEPSGMMLVLAADMVRGVLHASRVRRACPQWTIQVYTPPRAWPFSTWAVLAVMWHLAPEDAPTGTAEDIARVLHTWPADQDYPLRRPRGGLLPAPAAEGLSLAATLQRHPHKQARHFLQTGTVPATPPDSEWRWDAGVAQLLPGPWTLPLWYLPMGTLAHATQAVKGAFPQPLLPGVALLRSLQAGDAWVRWKEGKGRSSPYFPMVQGQALIHAEGMGTVEGGAIVPGTACRWITAAAPQPMRSPPACHGLLRMVPSLAPKHAFTRDVWKAVLSHTREWLTNPGARYPPGPVLEQLTAPTPGVLHALHRASASTKQLNDEVLDLALEPLRVLYPQSHIPRAGTSNRLGRLGLQRRVEAAHPGGVVEQWLTLRNPSTAEGHWYLHQLLFQPRAAPEHRRQNPYHTHLERRGAQNLPQPVPPALPPGQDPEALQQGPPLDTATTVQQRGSDGADGAEPDCRNCGAVAWTAACRHLARDTTGLRQYRPTDRTALASAVAAVTMGPVAAWLAQLLRHVPCRDTQPRRPAATHAPTAPLTAEQLYVVAAALLADGGESFVHHHGPAQIAGCIQGPQRDAPDLWHATLLGRNRVWGAGDGTPPPGPKQGETLVLQTAGYQAIIHGHAGGYRSHVLAGGQWTVWHSTARQGAFPPLPDIDWRQGPTQAYYMSADPWPAGGPATHRQRPQQEVGTGVGQPPDTGVEPRPGGASTGRVAGRRHQGHGRPGPPRGATHARPPSGYPGGGPTGTAEPAVGGLHVQPGGRAHHRLRPRAPAGARSRDPRGKLHPHDHQGAAGGRTPRPPAPGQGEAQRPGSEAGGVAGSGAPPRPRAPAGGPDRSVPLAAGLPRPAMEGQARPPNRLHALANVAASRRAGRCHPGSRARARDTSPRCGGPGPHTGATQGATGQCALRTSGGGRHSEVGAAPPGAGGHGADEMPPV